MAYATPASSKDASVLQRRQSVAAIGLGKIAQLKYLPYVCSQDNLELTTVVDRNDSLARAVGAKFGARQSFAAANLAERDWDFVLVLNHDHLTVMNDLLDRRIGRAVLVEKPMTWSWETALGVSKRFATDGRDLFPAFMLRHDAASAKAKQSISTYGPPTKVTLIQRAGAGSKVASTSDIKPDQPSRAVEKARLGERWSERFVGHPALVGKAVRLLLELAVHDLDLALYLLGPGLELRSLEFGESGRGAPFIKVHADHRGKTDCSVICEPAFDAEWEWDHRVEIEWPNTSLALIFGNPFADVVVSSVHIRANGENWRPVSLAETSFLDPFHSMLNEFFFVGADQASWSSRVDDAVEVLRLIDTIERAMLDVGDYVGKINLDDDAIIGR